MANESSGGSAADAQPLRLATRGSAQAVTQAEFVVAALATLGRAATLVIVDTHGDRTQAANVSLHSIGGQGVFVKEVQAAVLDGRADVAVHSAKDLPTETDARLTIGAYTARRDPADALVGRALADLPSGATIATGSVRRRAQLRRARPDLEFVELRGNIHTRLERIPDQGSIVMAVAALQVLDGTEEMGLPDDLIVQSWQGIQGGLEASRRGHQVIMSPNTVGCYLDYRHRDSAEEMGNLGVSTLRQVASFTATPPQMDEQAKSMVLGAQGNLWSERVLSARQAEYLLFPRLQLLAQQLWNPREADENLNRIELLTKYCEKLDIHCYRGAVE